MLRMTLMWIWVLMVIRISWSMEEMHIHRFKRVCYLTRESLTRHNPAGKFTLSPRTVMQDIPPYMCTHIIYTFAKLDVGNFTIKPGKNDAIPGGNYAILNSLKGSSSSPKTLLSIGGPNTDTRDFEKIARDDAVLIPFVENLISFLRFHNFNGIEIDWQYPGDIVSMDNPNDGKSLFIGFLWSLRKAFVLDGRQRDKSRLLLSVATGVSEKHINKSYNFPMLSSLTDFITIRSCDYHGSWDKKTGMNSPLYPAYEGDKLNIASTVNTMVSQGARADKLVVTLCAKGSSFTLVSDKTSNIESETSGPGIQGPFVQKLGSMAYFEVCVILREKGTRMWQNIQKNPYVVRDRLWIGYDDVESIALKADWVVKQKLGGAAIWSLDLDDFRGKFCKKGKYPLAVAMETVLKRADRKFFNMAFGNEAGNEVTEQEEELEKIRDLSAMHKPVLRARPRIPRPRQMVKFAKKREEPAQMPQPPIEPEEKAVKSREALPLISKEVPGLPEEQSSVYDMQNTAEPMGEEEEENARDGTQDEEQYVTAGNETAVIGTNEKLKDSAGSLKGSVILAVLGYLIICLAL